MTPFIPTYRRTGSPLHAVRPSVGILYLAGPCLVALAFDHPLALAGALVGTIAAGVAARLGPELARAALFAAPLALMVALANPLVSREGLTVLAGGPVVPVLGRLDLTLEAVAYGGLAALRVMVIALAFGLYSTAVNPDDVLRLVRRLSVRSALTASLATRLVPLLARDAERLAEAYELRAARPPAGSRRQRVQRAATLTRALAAGALERAVDLAAALEVRGFTAMPRRGSSAVSPAPWSRHDLTFALAALAGLVLVAVSITLGSARFEPYPEIEAAHGAGAIALPFLIVATMIAPFLVSAWSKRRLHRGERTHLWSGEAAIQGEAGV